jgi:hypothetical protein
MHPILSQFRRVLIYLLAWIPIAGLLAYLLTVSHELSDHEAIVLSVPLCLLYAFLCLTSWYSCRGNPLEKYSLGRLIATHLTAALVAAIIWAVAAESLASTLSKMQSFPGGSFAGDRHRPAALSALGNLVLRDNCSRSLA